MTTRGRLRWHRGFTMIELMMVVAIVGILAGIAIGYSGNFLRAESMKEVARNVVSALQQGRAEAVRTSTKVYVNFGPQRMYAFVDMNGNYVYDPGEKLIFQYPTGTSVLQTGQTVTSTALAATNPSNQVTAIFDYQGYSVDYQNNPISAVVCIKDTQLIDVRAVQLTIAGSSRVQIWGAGKALCP